MKIDLTLPNNRTDISELTAWLCNELNAKLDELEPKFIQDLSHINPAARYAGEMKVDEVEFLKSVKTRSDSETYLFRCHYSYNWEIGWTCSGTSESGRVHEKVRVQLAPNGELEILFLKLDVA